MLNGENERKYYSCRYSKETLQEGFFVTIILYFLILLLISMFIGKYEDGKESNCVIDTHFIRYDESLSILGYSGLMFLFLSFLISMSIAKYEPREKAEKAAVKLFTIYFTFMIIWTTITTVSFFDSAYESCKEINIWNFFWVVMPSMYILNIIGLYSV